MHVNRKVLLQSALLSCLAAGLVAGCARTATAPESPRISDANIHFITGLYNMREFDNKVIGEEIQRASDPRVVALAQRIQTHVNQFYAKVEPVAKRDGISPPDTVTLTQQSDMQTRIAALMGKGKYDFDLEFLDDEIAAHSETLSYANDTLQEPAGDPELKALLQEGAGTLQRNLNDLKALREALKSEGR